MNTESPTAKAPLSGRRRGRRAMVVGICLAVTFAVSVHPAGVDAVSMPAPAQNGIRAQYVGASTFGIGFNNPISAWANASMWQSATASVAMRDPLENLGYSTPQIDSMSADEMITALRGGPVAGSGAPAAAPSSAVAISLTPLPPNAKVQTAKGTLEGLVFPVTTATKFVPTKKRLAVKQLVTALTKDKAVQPAINELVELGFSAYESEARADGLVNDVAGSMAFFVGTCDLIISDGVEPDPEGLVLVARMLQQVMENPKIKKVSAADKQRMYEFLVGFSTVLLATYEVSVEGGDAATVADLKSGCTSFGRNVLKADFATFDITGFGVGPES